jgi:paraquat-inducible protein A
LLNDVPELDVGQKAYCPRCGYLLAANRPNIERTIFVVSLTALVLLVLSSAFPFLGFSVRGQEQTVTLIQSVAILVTENFPELAFVVFVTIFAVPAMLLLGTVYVSSGILLRRKLPGMRLALRSVLKLIPWSMAEIFLIGILVSFVKIVSLADVSLGLSFWTYSLFTVCIVVVVAHIDKRELWRSVGVLSNV